MGYISELREVVGTRPLMMPGSCVVVLNDNREVLLQKRSDSLDWGTIGGALELGESFEEAAARELHEEAGLKAERFAFVSLLSGADMYYRYPHGDEIYNIMVVFEAIGVTGEPTSDNDEGEGLELRYFPLNQPIDDLNWMSRLVLRKAGYLP
jgi:8-oxo-dGTP pyrophosphatase MutT (NUDIX family)